MESAVTAGANSDFLLDQVWDVLYTPDPQATWGK